MLIGALDAGCPLVFFDAIRVKIRDEGFVCNKAAIACGGHDVLRPGA
jgi:transposase-like protein